MRLPAECARRFRVERPLASSRFGTVLLGRWIELDWLVALELLRADLA